jgi:hypothetical protein
MYQERFDVSKGDNQRRTDNTMINRKGKRGKTDKQCNSQQKKKKRTKGDLQNTTKTTKERETRITFEFDCLFDYI